MTAIETTAVDSRTPPGFDGGPDEGPRDLKERITRLLAGYTTAQKAGAAGVAVAVVVGLLLVSRLTGGPEYAPLYTELTAEDGGAIVAELEKQGIPHRISQGGTSILVPADKVHETRMKLSSTELPGDTKVGYGVLDNQGLTTSEFGQRVGFQRAMEGELARTIESLDAVDTAVVHLALPAEQVFARDDEKPSASVLVRTKGSEQLSEDQVRAIVNLVASGIEGMSPDSVTVADSDGNVLSAPGQGVTSAAGSGTRQRQTADFEDGVEKALEDMLASVVGPNGADVTVSAVLNFDEESMTRETYEAPEQGPGGPLVLEESTRGENYAGTPPQTGGVLGPDTPPIQAGGEGTDYELEEADVRYAVNRAIESTNRAPGRIERLSVAVALDEAKVTENQVANLTPLLEAGAGIDPERGDVLSVSRTPFDDGSEAREAAEAQLRAEEEARAAAARGALIRNLGIGAVLLGLVLAAFLLHRRATRRRDEELEALLAGEAPAELPPAPATAVAEELDDADAVELSPEAIEGPPETPELPALEETEAAEETDEEEELLDPEEHERMVRHAAVAELIEHQPDEVAALLRSWLGDRRAVQR